MHTAGHAREREKKEGSFRKQNTTLKKPIFEYKRLRLSAKSGDLSLTGDKSGGCSARTFVSPLQVSRCIGGKQRLLSSSTTPSASRRPRRVPKTTSTWSPWSSTRSQSCSAFRATLLWSGSRDASLNRLSIFFFFLVTPSLLFSYTTTFLFFFSSV